MNKKFFILISAFLILSPRPTCAAFSFSDYLPSVPSFSLPSFSMPSFLSSSVSMPALLVGSLGTATAGAGVYAYRTWGPERSTVAKVAAHTVLPLGVGCAAYNFAPNGFLGRKLNTALTVGATLASVRLYYSSNKLEWLNDKLKILEAKLQSITDIQNTHGIQLTDIQRVQGDHTALSTNILSRIDALDTKVENLTQTIKRNHRQVMSHLNSIASNGHETFEEAGPGVIFNETSLQNSPLSYQSASYQKPPIIANFPKVSSTLVGMSCHKLRIPSNSQQSGSLETPVLGPWVKLLNNK